MSYPGNTSLSQETKDRITSTFHQTLDLAKEGRHREAVLGCDFILRMDPLFQPARTLQERLQGTEGPVQTADLDMRPTEPQPSAGGSFDTMHLDATQVRQLGSEAGPSIEGGGIAPDTSAPLPDLGNLDANALSLDPVEPPQPLASPPPVPPPAPAEPTPRPERRSAGAGRIDELLEEGQLAFDGGEFQKAIDAWSRIFLIDIDHQEAAQRIEQARRYKAEKERQVDQAMHEAMSHREAGELMQARRGFEKVLELQPNHITAREQLAELDGGGGAAPLPPLETTAQPTMPEMAPPAPQPAPSPPAAMPPSSAPSLPPSPVSPPPVSAESTGFDEGPGGGSGDSTYADDLYGSEFDSFAEEDALPRGSVPQAPVTAKAGAAKPQRSFFLIGVLVLIVAGGAGWYLYDRWGSIFPNAEEPIATAPAVDVVQQATRLRLAGNTEGALEQLRALPPDHPAYGRAQVLIEQWSGEVEAEGTPTEPTDIDREQADRMARREALLQRARQAYAEREYLPAAKAFKAADDVEPLEGAAADLYEDTKRQLRPIAPQIDLFQQREWEMVVPMLWRKLEDDPDNRDLSRMLADSYFNLGVRDLQRGVPREAEGRFKEVVSLNPEDQMAQRLFLFSAAYAQSSRDVLYDIYVKQLRFRR